MYIQEIILDGFKSYAQKTVISGFDPQFNAITGLNGTGKSNILDSICFVLGISNLSQVRVGNLQELVYKQGQAGINKATVTIIFNNSDVSTSPIGYESHKQISVTRQIVIGGKNKYMINGHTVQQSQVQNFFHSVQLNVNNPHFLIMQGRITKVLNMKPPEILSMIEEAAGTRMFETKKQASLKTIEKKQAKVDEITKCIEEEINPTLENLRQERIDYHKYQKNQVEYEKLSRVLVAHDFLQNEEKLKNSEGIQLGMTNELQSYEATIEVKNQEIVKIDEDIQAILLKKDSELGSEIDQLKEASVAKSKEIVKADTLLKNHNETVNNEISTQQDIVKSINQIENLKVSKNKALSTLTQQIQEKEIQTKSLENNSNSLKEKYQNFIAGKTDEKTTELLSVQEQVITWEKLERETTSKLQTNQQNYTFHQKRLKEFEKKYSNVLNSKNSSYDQIQDENEKLKFSINEKENQLRQFSSVENSMKELGSEINQMNNELSSLQNNIDLMNVSLQVKLSFDYTNPEKNFNREERVKGFIASLFTFSDKKYALPLEVIAGGKLLQIVVDNEQTGKLLLTKGNLKKRVTILPLNKLSAKPLSKDKLAKAKQIAKEMNGTAFLALELVQYSPEVSVAMDYTFGTTIVCSSNDIAKTIAFHKDIKCKTVTLEGDSYDPAGILTGGSTTALGTLLNKLYELNELKLSFQEKAGIRNKLQDNYSKLEEKNNAYNTLMKEIDLLKHHLLTNEQRLLENDFTQILLQRQEIEKELISVEEEKSHLQETLEKAKSELAKISKSEKSNNKSKESKLKEFEKEMKAAQQEFNASKKELIALNSKKEALLAELQSIEKELQSLQEQKSISDAALIRYQKEKKEMEEKLSTMRKDYESTNNLLLYKTKESNQYSQEITDLEKEKSMKTKEIHAIQMEIKKVTHKLQKWEKDIKDSQKLIANYLKEYSWISKEKQYFGKENTDFDFKAYDLKNAQHRLQELKADQDKLSKKINKKVMGMIETAEAEYEDLTKKRQVILNDKAKIESVIEELDVKKIQSLEKTYEQVNKDFGSIFSMLLPGTTAKLDQLEGQHLMDGLEVKVAFNGVWKESLTELSGGQRSLLALSLILALLLFKPAPMYILDEVDAALDLSHTQNIGLMIRTHFASSQFIVVSLKEGMFNNANVIFRTKFVDGISAVTRTVSGLRAGKTSLLTNGTKKKNSLTSSEEDYEKEDDENVENEIQQVVKSALNSKKKSSTVVAKNKKVSVGKKKATESDDDSDGQDLSDEDFEAAPARKKGRVLSAK